MVKTKCKSRILSCICTALLAFGAGNLATEIPVYAESGTVYSCTINRSYSNPVTGEVEDSGGEASYATGQGMVEGAVYGSGLMEVTDSGNYYLTVRLSLMDYTSDHSFTVQNVGDSGWMSTGVAVTANGSDSNGTTADLCIQVPGENCIVRGSMYVTPMGRNVIFYFYPTNYSEGNSVGMTPAFVTESSGTSAQENNDTTQSMDTASAQEETDSSDEENGSDTQEESSDTEGTSGSDVSETADSDNTTSDTSQNQSDGAGDSGTQGTQSQASINTGSTQSSAISTQQSTVFQSSSTQSNGSSTQAASDTDQELNSAQGLSLSTASKDSSTTKETAGEESSISLNPYVLLGLTITISGLILIFAGALVVWYFHRNWRRWSGEDDDDDDED